MRSCFGNDTVRACSDRRSTTWRSWAGDDGCRSRGNDGILDRLKPAAIRDQFDKLPDKAARSDMTLREALANSVRREIAGRLVNIYGEHDCAISL